MICFKNLQITNPRDDIIMWQELILSKQVIYILRKKNESLIKLLLQISKTIYVSYKYYIYNI